MASFGRASADKAQAGAMAADEVSRAYREFGAKVLRRCCRILRDRVAAEDATQEVFLKLWRYGQSFREADCKLSWLYRVADRCCFTELRRRQSRRELPGDERTTTPAVNGLPEDRQLLLRLLSRFDDRVQQVAILHFVEQMTQDEIASATGWSRQTIHKKLRLVRHRARAWRLRLFGERA